MPPATITSTSNQLPCDQPQCQAFRDHPRRRCRELSLERSSNIGEPQVSLRPSFSHRIVAQMSQTAPFLLRKGSLLHPQAKTLYRRHQSTDHRNSDASIMEKSLPSEEVQPVQDPKTTHIWLYTKPHSRPHEIYPTYSVRQLQNLSEVQKKFHDSSSFSRLMPPSGPSLESSKVPFQRPSTPMPNERNEVFEMFIVPSSCPAQESLLSYPSNPSTGLRIEMSSCKGLKSSLSSLQKRNSAGDKKKVCFREPLETYFPESPDDSEEEMEEANEQKYSPVVPFYHSDVELMNNRCHFENKPLPFVQEQQMGTPTRARAGMDCPTSCGSSCCNPCKRSICGSPWPSDVVEAQIASCAPCMPPCPPPCCQMRYCPCPVFGDGLLQQDYNFHRKFRAVEKCPVGAVQFIESENREKRHHSGCEHNMVCGIDPCACTGPFDMEEAMHHKYRGVSKDQCGQTEVSENECRQRRQYGDCPPPCCGPCGPCGPC